MILQIEAIKKSSNFCVYPESKDSQKYNLSDNFLTSFPYLTLSDGNKKSPTV